MSNLLKTTDAADEGFWSIVFTAVFTVLTIIAICILNTAGTLPTSIELFDFSILALAVFRTVRLLTYDSIAQFIRDWFVQKTIHDDGTVTRAPLPYGLRRSLGNLISCPWCIAVWITLFYSFFYFLTEFAWYPLLLLAIAGVASVFQIFANLIGWHAEYKKITTQKLD